MTPPWKISLDSVVSRLVEINRWPENVAKLVSYDYCCYLKLKIKYPQTVLPPSREIDEFWHAHILDTKKYHKDCLYLFGEYLHHAPHHKSMSRHEIDRIQNLFEENTQRLYYEEFGICLEIIYPKLYKGDFMHWLKKLFCRKKAKAAICL